jgi:tetratricopeptide (TPR) repeat protein
VNRGLALWHSKDIDQALFCFTKGTEIEFEEKHMAYYYRAQVKAEIGDYWGAIDDYASAIQLKPGFINLWLKKAPLWLKVNRYDSAMREYRTAFTLLESLHHGSPEADEKKTYESSIDDITEALRHNARNNDGYVARFIAYLLLGNNEEALNNIKTAIELTPKSAESHLFQGLALMNLKKYEEARASFNKAIELNPKMVRALYNRAMAYVDDGQVDRAIEDLSQVITLAPDYSLARLNRGTCYALQKDYSRAIADFDSVPVDSPNYDNVLLFRGLAKSDLGNREQAKEDLKRAFRLTRSGEVRDKASAELLRLGAPLPNDRPVN